MIYESLFQKVLIDPIKLGCNQLNIISGYASAAMAFRHISELYNLERTDIKIKLVIGMSPIDGISLTNHNGFKHLMTNLFKDNLVCSYKMNKPPVHTKLYQWLIGDKPMISFLGSANYTQNGFINQRQKEALTVCSNNDALNYLNDFESDTIYCTHPDSENIIQIFNEKTNKKRIREEFQRTISDSEDSSKPDYSSLDFITVSLLDRMGNIQNKAGLNWGQRPGREPNQAYIHLKPEIYKSDFFPKRSTHFTVYTDDQKSLILTRAQKNDYGAAIETPLNNSWLGEYFRNRLGLPNGAFITKDHLLKYGRTDVTFYKIDDENYYMDFSV